MYVWDICPALTPFQKPLLHIGQTGLDLGRTDDIKVKAIQQD